MSTQPQTVGEEIKARNPNFVRDVISVSTRALRSLPRDLESVIPPLIFPVFFFFVMVGSLEDLAEGIPGVDYKAFQLPVAIIFAVTGVSRAITVVIDIQTGYLDRLLLTPVNRVALILGLMVADIALIIFLTIPVLILGAVLGVSFASGIAGVAVFVVISVLWGLAYSGFVYAIAFKFGNPGAVNSSFLLFLPFVFLSTVYLPKEALTGWMATIVTYNPVTYLLGALRALVTEGWDGAALVEGLLAILLVAVISMGLAASALRARVKRG